MKDFLRRHGRLLLALLLFLFALGFAVLRVTTFSKGFGLRLGTAAWALLDFRTAIYYPIVAFLDGINPYDRVTMLASYPTRQGFGPFLPATLLLHLPFGLLPLSVSSLLYVATTVALTLLLAYLAFRYNDLEARPADVLLVAAVILLSRPGQWNLLLGQLAVQLALATYVALYYARRSPVVSGLGLAVSMVKPSVGLPLALLMLARRDNRAVLLGCAFAAIANLPLLAVLARRAGGVTPFVAQLTGVVREFGARAWNDPSLSIARVDATALISRFLGVPLGGVAQALVAIAVLGLAALALRRMAARAEEPANFAMSTGIICAALLLSVYHQAYDLILLTLPAVALAYSGVPALLRPHRRRWFLLGLVGILAANYAATEAVLSALRMERGLWLVLVSVNGLALLTLFCVYSVAALNSGSSAQPDDPRATPARDSEPAGPGRAVIPS